MGNAEERVTPLSCHAQVTKGARYRHDPYGINVMQAPIVPWPHCDPSAECPAHAATLGVHVHFVQLPLCDTIGAGSPDNAPAERLFVGQAPYGMTQSQLQRLLRCFRPGAQVLRFDPMTRKREGKDAMRDGCCRVWVAARHADALCALLRRRVLFDRGGAWVASTPHECEVLERFTAAMKADEALRVPGLPYQMLVLEKSRT